jgi:hypothetical protein
VPVHVGFVVDTVTVGQVLFPSSAVFLCQYHSFNKTLGTRYLSKNMKIRTYKTIVDCRLLVVMGRDFVSALQSVAYCTVPG